MAVRTASPWWLSAVLAVGLVFLFLGERPFDHIDSARLACTGLGALVILGTTALRALLWLRSTGDRRRVERVFLLCHAGVLAGLAGYVLTTGWGTELVGLANAEPETLDRWTIPVTILSLIALTASLLPLLLVELSLGTARRNRLYLGAGGAPDGDDGAVELFRVREMAGSGLTIALAAGFLMATCNVAGQRNVRKDYSYFKTSSPGEATINVVESVDEKLHVLLFFPGVNEVKEEVRGYFEALDAATDGLIIEEHDRYAERKLASEHRINQDGYIVIVRGDKSEKLRIDPDLKKARRNDLRTLDSKVHGKLMKVARERRFAYMTIGHGEFNDPKSLGALADKYPSAAASELEDVLEELNYEVKKLGLQQGLGNAVPDDADLVVMLAPKTALLPEELESLRSYLADGGAMLIALDPAGEADLGPIGDQLGLEFEGTPLADDRYFFRRVRGPSARLFITTNQFSSHESVTTLSRRRTDEALVFGNAGHLVDAEYQGDGEAPKKTYVVRSMSNSWADANENLRFDADTEQRRSYNLAAAIEADRGDGGDEADEPAGMRAFVVADAEVLSDAIMKRLFLPRHFASDAIKWLGGEEQLAGETVSEKDVYIEHTKSEDVVWFYSTIVGAPVLVLAFGLGVVALRRRRNLRRSS